jgi:hypothetical protein
MAKAVQVQVLSRAPLHPRFESAGSAVYRVAEIGAVVHLSAHDQQRDFFRQLFGQATH